MIIKTTSIFSSLLLLTVTSLNTMADNHPSSKLSYPDTRKGDTVTTYFDTKVADPYRWLEDDLSDETAAWVKAQNKVTFGYLDQIPYRNKIKQDLEQRWNYERVSKPFEEGEYTYFFKNDGLQNQGVLYRKDKSGKTEIFLDPNSFSKDGSTALTSIEFSENSKMAAYMTSEAGSDWRNIKVIDVETKKQIGEVLENVKFSGIAWRGNEGFYYSSYEKPKGSNLSAKTDQHRLFFHNINEPQSKDKIIFGGTEEQKRRYVGGYVTEDQRFLVITAANSTTNNNLYVVDLKAKDKKLITVVGDQTSDAYVLTSKDDTLYIMTNRGAPNGKLVTTSVDKPQPENWKLLIAETDNVLSASTGGGYIFASYMMDAISRVYQYDYTGKQVREITLPGQGTVSSIGGKKKQSTLYYQFSNYVTPQNIYSLNVNDGKSDLYHKSGAKFDSSKYESKQVFYKSKDGTRIPMIISFKKGIKLDGSNPTILYGYGGFNISITPSFKIPNAYWLENGGVYAVANLRGGGEYGQEWHNAGTQQNKQNVFDDFIAAAEYLIAEKYTSANKLAATGRSNGGLLVGAVQTQRPELFAAAIPGVGVLDMLRYHTFTAGAGWAYDYGTAEDSKAMFDYLYGYSPVHNVKKGTSYPATMVVTNDHDDRVVPAHSFKFAAELQDKHVGDAPVLIRIETNAGHGAGMSVSKQIATSADELAFMLFNMGVKSLPIRD